MCPKWAGGRSLGPEWVEGGIPWGQSGRGRVHMNGCAEAWRCSSMLQGLCECESRQEAFTSSPGAAGSGIVCLPMAAIVKMKAGL